MIGKRSPRLELVAYGFVLGFMILSGIQVQNARADCIERHGVNYSLTPSETPLMFDCHGSESETYVPDALDRAVSLILLHFLPFGMGYRVKVCIDELREGDS